LEELETDARVLVKHTKDVSDISKAFIGESGDNFTEVITPFVSEAAMKTDSLTKLLGKAKKDFIDVVEWFGYPKEKIKSKTVPGFFGCLNSFIKSFKLIWIEQDKEENKSNDSPFGKGKIGAGDKPFDDLATKIKLTGNTPAKRRLNEDF